MEVNLLYIINDFIVSFNLFNASFLNKLINFFKKNHSDAKLLDCSHVYSFSTHFYPKWLKLGIQQANMIAFPLSVL